jgi:hypothetical protein
MSHGWGQTNGRYPHLRHLCICLVNFVALANRYWYCGLLYQGLVMICNCGLKSEEYLEVLALLQEYTFIILSRLALCHLSSSNTRKNFSSSVNSQFHQSQMLSPGFRSYSPSRQMIQIWQLDQWGTGRLESWIRMVKRGARKYISRAGTYPCILRDWSPDTSTHHWYSSWFTKLLDISDL